MGSEIRIKSKFNNKIEVNGKLDNAMEVSPTGVVAGELSRLPKEELGNCVSNREDDMFHMEISRVRDGNGVETKQIDEDLEVDIIGNTIPDEGEQMVGDRESKDATECSSSFGFTDSGSGPADMSGDMEVESQLRDDNAMLMGFDGFGDLFRTRKKKLTDEWRKFARPLIWRCKWAELQVRELQSQEAKYARELAEWDQRKKCQLENCSTDDNAMKSSPFISQRPIKLMKRKKRKRVEETVNIDSYIKGHSLFSHFVKSGADTANVGNNHGRAGTSGSGEFGIDDELSSLQFKDSDAFESILRKIEEAQVHVRDLRMRMDKVVRDHDQSTKCNPNSGLAHLNNNPTPLESKPSTSRWPSKQSVMPKTVGSIAKRSICSDMIKTIGEPLTVGGCEKIGKEILIRNRLVKEEYNSSEDDQLQRLTKSPSEPEVKLETAQHATDPGLGIIKMPQGELSAILRSSSRVSFPKIKGKRGVRKALTGRWNKR